MVNVFIDGSAGTTGLKIVSRLSGRKDLRLITLPEAQRKEIAARKDAMNRADVVFLCLPDDAAREAVTLIDNDRTAVIDTSTAHRTQAGWTYGFPEIGKLRDQIRVSKRIANPGCHASGFIALIAPLTLAGVLSPDAMLSCFSLTGYSGGGKKMIAEYEAADRPSLLDAPRQYGVGQHHKHLPEMQKVCGLAAAPIFCPIVAPYFSGMEVTVPLFASLVPGERKTVEDVYRAAYDGNGLVRFVPEAGEGGFLSAGAFAGRDDMEISVQGNEDRLLLVARFDNLGKGASGAAIQNMNLLLGADEKTGLVTG